MGKVVKTIIKVAIVAAAVAIMFVPGVNAAVLGLFQMATWGTALAGAAAVLAKLAIASIMTAALGILQKAFTKRPNLNQTLFDRLNKRVDGMAPRRFFFGRTALAADIRFFEKYGSKSDKYVEVLALASHRINALLSIHFEDFLTYSGGATVGKYAAGMAGISPRLVGTATNTMTLGSGTYWKSPFSRFTGCAYVALDYKLDSKLWPEGIPTRITTTGEACPVYDPRRDGSMYGVGAHRITDNDTWEWRSGGVEIGRNPALCLLAFLIGWYIRDPATGEQRLAWGMGVPLSRIDWTNFIFYANLCEERVTLQAGGTVQRYTCDGGFSTADTHDSVTNGICSAMGSTKLVDVEGRYQLIGGYDDTMEPMIELGPDDFVGAYEWRPAPAIRETFNIVRGKFADPALLYQLNDYPAVEVNPRPDGVPRNFPLDFPTVSRAETCQRIAKQWVLRDIMNGSLAGMVGPRAFLCRVGKPARITLPAEGFQGKIFRVIEQSETHELIFTMAFREDGPFIYGWDREEKPLPPSIRPPGYAPEDALTPENYQAAGISVTGSDGQVIPFIRHTWTPELSGRTSGIELSARKAGSAEWSVVPGLVDPTLGDFLQPGPAGGIGIETRARFRMANGIFGPFVDDVDATPAAIYGATPAQVLLITQAINDAALAQATADGQIQTFYQNGTPTGASEGDLWFRPDIGKWHIYTAGAWTTVTDSQIGAAILAAAGAQATADGKVTTYYSLTDPAGGAHVGDLWVYPGDSYVYRWNGSQWQPAANIGATAAQLSNIALALSKADQAQATADGKIDTFYSTSAPAGAEGDLWYNPTDGKWRRLFADGIWYVLTDAQIGTAITAAAGAQATADGKVTTYWQDAQPGGALALGDLWFRPTFKDAYRYLPGSGWIKLLGNLSGFDTVGTPIIDPKAVTTPKLDDFATYSYSTVAGDLQGWRSVAGVYNPGGGSIAASITTPEDTTGMIISIRFTFVAMRDGGDDDNMVFSCQRSDGTLLQYYYNVQMHGGRRMYHQEFVDFAPAPNTTYTYMPYAYSVGDGNPFFYSYVFSTELRKK